MSKYVSASGQGIVVDGEHGELHAPWRSVLNIVDTGTGLRIGWTTGMGVMKVDGPNDGTERDRVIRCFMDAATRRESP